jgi:hypothetical protein
VFVFLCKFSGALAFAICFGYRILLTGGNVLGRLITYMDNEFLILK